MAKPIGAAYLGIAEFWTEDRKDEHTRGITQRLNDVLKGKMNVVYSLTLTPNATSTVLESTNISGQSSASFMPETASAAAAQSSLYAKVEVGKITFTHDSNPATDRTFRIVVVG